MNKLFFLVALFTSREAVLAQNKAILTLDEPTFDFGTLPYAGYCQHNFVFTNTGTEPLIISNVVTSCGCDVPSWQKDVIMPGKKGVIGYHYDSNRPGVFNKTMTVTGNFDGDQFVILIKGDIRPKGDLPEVTVWPKNYFKPNDNLAPAEKNMLKTENKIN